jgi:hypothetical protein
MDRFRACRCALTARQAFCSLKSHSEWLSRDSGGSKQVRQQFVLGVEKWIRDCYPLQRKTIVQVFRQLKMVSCFRGRRENHRVADAELMSTATLQKPIQVPPQSASFFLPNL